MNECESQQGKVVTARPPKRILAQLCSLFMSDSLPAEQWCQAIL